VRLTQVALPTLGCENRLRGSGEGLTKLLQAQTAKLRHSVGLLVRDRHDRPETREFVVAVLGHRDDIQGLRAVAVLLVVLCHADVSFIAGGYVGVDVFFVLSGFLITGVLLAGAAKRGHVALFNFYARRAKRILPAATLTLITTIVAAYYLLNYVRAKEAIWDSFWASMFAANVRLAHQGTDYFAQGQPPSLVQHYWSLAVEEQFYLVWPALLSITLYGVSLRRRSRTDADGRHDNPAQTKWGVRRLLIVVALAASASLVWSIHYTYDVPAAAYFSTFARAWELGLGAALALCALQVSRVPARVRAALGWVGVSAIGVAAVTFSPLTPFPGFAALLPTVGTALVIGAGIGDQPRYGVGRILAVTPMRYVGDRSYAYYLWHWPVLIIAVEYHESEISVPLKLLLMGGAFLLSMLSYRTFENPIRRARWSPRVSALLVPASAAAVIVATVLTLTALNAKIFRLENATAGEKSAPVSSLATGEKVAKTRALPAVIAAVKAARRGGKIPSPLAPPVSQLLKDLYYFPSGCDAAENASTSKICRLGDEASPKTLVFFGDSHAEMLMPTVLKLAARDGWAVIPLVKSGCNPGLWLGSGFPNTPTQQISLCHAWYKWALGKAKSLRPDVTLMAGCCGGVVGTTAAAETRGYTSLARAMRRFSASVVLVADNEGVRKEPVDCLLARGATMRTCTTKQASLRLSFNNHLATLATSAGFGFMKTRGWFCYQNECPMVVANTIVYRDKGHITQTYAVKLTGAFRAAFRRCILDVCAR
jgi:peptidoglycan/LPS O-acetylase OafA/YrhL